MTLIDNSGIAVTSAAERLAALETRVRAIFGADIDLAPESPDGQLLAVLAGAIAGADQLAAAVYAARSPASARGAALARLVRLNGITRKREQFSTAPITLGGDPGTVIPSGALIASTDPQNPTAVFATVANYTIDSGGTAAGQVRATMPGPVASAPGTITSVKTVISGWSTATNPTAATLGALGETDPALRARRERSVAIPSQGILDGLFAELSQLADVQHVVVFENEQDRVLSPITPNGGGSLPAHSIQAIVDGGSSGEIAAALWRRKALGVTTVGALSDVALDVQGFPHTMRFDRPVDVNVYVTVRVNGIVSAADAAAIRTALVDYGSANAEIGKTVVWSRLFVPINTVTALGIAAVYLGSAPDPTLQVNLSVPYNGIARWDIGRIDVVSG